MWRGSSPGRSRRRRRRAREVEWPSAKDILATHPAVSSSRVPATGREENDEEATADRRPYRPWPCAGPLGPAGLVGRAGRGAFYSRDRVSRLRSLLVLGP